MVSALDMQIADNIKSLRKKHKEFQVDLAAILDVGRTFISDVENHRRAYNLDHINKIAIHYSCSLHEIIPKNPFI